MTSPTVEPTDLPARARPVSVDWAFRAIIVRCVLSITGAVLLFPEHDALVRATQRLNPTKTDAQVRAAVGSAGPQLFAAILICGLVLLLAKLILDGKNWARWLYVAAEVLLVRTVFAITLLLSSSLPASIRLTYGLTGLAAITAISLLFVRPSAPYFRPAGSAGSGVAGMSALFARKPRTGTVLSKPEIPADARPRAKSRKKPAE